MNLLVGLSGTKQIKIRPKRGDTKAKIAPIHYSQAINFVHNSPFDVFAKAECKSQPKLVQRWAHMPSHWGYKPAVVEPDQLGVVVRLECHHISRTERLIEDLVVAHRLFVQVSRHNPKAQVGS